MNLTELARKLGKNKATISRHARRLGVGTYGPGGMKLTDAEARLVAGAVATAKIGNPNWVRGKEL